MGSVDKTLFTLNHGTDFLLVQIYVDDIRPQGRSGLFSLLLGPIIRTLEGGGNSPLPNSILLCLD
jgi:hypothetical protein